MSVTITGIQEVQRANEHNIAQLRPSGALGRAVQFTVIQAHRYAVAITHVDTGALRASHRMEVIGVHGRIFLDPSARNPRSGALTSNYGAIEETRGGSHAFYERTAYEGGPSIVRAAIAGFIGELR